MTNSPITAEFQDFFTERSQAGVRIAEAVTNIELQDRTLTVTFDPAATILTIDLFESFIKIFDNLAEFAGTPMMFADDQGNRLREHVDTVATQYPDGTALGTLTASELYEIGTGETLAP